MVAGQANDMLREGDFRIWRAEGSLEPDLLYLEREQWSAHFNEIVFLVRFSWSETLIEHPTSSLLAYTRPFWASRDMVLEDALGQECRPHTTLLNADGDAVFYWSLGDDLDDGGEETLFRDYVDKNACTRWE